MNSTHTVTALALLSLTTVAACGRDAGEINTAPTGSPSLTQQVERGVELAGAVLDDATVTAKVKAELLAEPDLSGMAIDVDTQRNVVTLRGTVRSEDARQRAASLSRAVEGVAQVKNELAVASTRAASSEPTPRLQSSAHLTTSDTESGNSAFWRADSAAVKDLQRRLRQSSYDVGPIDGILGPRTREALVEFQRDQGNTATGDLDAGTIASLGMQEVGAGATSGAAAAGSLAGSASTQNAARSH